MRREVLDYLHRQGGLILFAFPGVEVPHDALERFALAMNAGARFVVLDFTNNREAIPKNDAELREFHQKIAANSKDAPYTIGILPTTPPEGYMAQLVRIAKAVVIDACNLEEASVLLEDSPILQTAPIVFLSNELPSGKRFPHARKACKRSPFRLNRDAKGDWRKDPQPLVRALEYLIKIGILQKNTLDGPYRFIRRMFPLLLLLAIALPFIIPNQLDRSASNLRDRISERNKLTVAPSFDYTFDGKETLQRICRYAIGRFNAVITNDKMIQKYAETTLEENGYVATNWIKNNLIYPPEGTVVKFSRPDNLTKSTADSIGAAWKYWTSIVSDSIAYITEFYHEKATSQNRQHNGIDVASRKGARILAPYAAKAWTSQDERGGTIIGLVRDKDVMIFMHCDQLLYLDGQEVMQGDPIATVGITGHTTGPHAHIVTGIIDKRGTKRIGNVSYKVIDPIHWFYRFKPSAPK